MYVISLNSCDVIKIYSWFINVANACMRFPDIHLDIVQKNMLMFCILNNIHADNNLKEEQKEA